MPYSNVQACSPKTLWLMSYPAKPDGDHTKDYCGGRKLSKHSLFTGTSESLKGSVVFANSAGLSYSFLSAGASVIELTFPSLLLCLIAFCTKAFLMATTKTV